MQHADSESEIPEEIRKHLAPWRQTLLEIIDKVKLEREKEEKQRARTKTKGGAKLRVYASQ